MSYKPKTYKKFVATASTATLVAKAISPVKLNEKRLEGIKEELVMNVKLKIEDVNWLIKQAERVDYLEKVYTFETKQYEKYKKIAVEVTSELEKENARFREALEFYADSMLNGSEARKALAGESK